MLKSNFLNSNYLLMAVAVILGSIMTAVPYINNEIVTGMYFEVTIVSALTAFASFSLALMIAYVSWNKEALELKAALKAVKQH
jgi:hypothetical protein